MHSPAFVEQPRIGAVGFQFSTNVDWQELPIGQPTAAFESPAATPQPTGVRALYARLAEAYEAEPPTEHRRSGTAGDPYPL